MKLVLEHAFPKRFDYFRVFANIGAAYFYLSVDGWNVQWFGRIHRDRNRPASLSDNEYHRYRIEHPVEKILAEEEDQVVVKTSDGVEETWIMPRWLLRRRRVVNA